MLESLFANNENEDIQIFAIIDDDITQEDKSNLDNIAYKHHSKHIVYTTFPQELLKVFPGTEHSRVTKAVYFRLFSATLLPAEVTKILYLDGDIIITDNLRNLWETNLAGIAVAGVMDEVQTYALFNRLHYSSKFGYINTGVLLINLKYWRENQTEKQFADFIYRHPDWIIAWDQDVLNYVLKEEKHLLPLKYNVQQHFYYKPEYCNLDYWTMESEILDAQRHPSILHFSGFDKPWRADCGHPKVSVFLAYKNQTIWADYPLYQYEVKKTWRQRLRHFLEKLGLLNKRPQIITINKYIDCSTNQIN